MVAFGRSSNGKKQSEIMRPSAYIVIGIFTGFFIGVSFHTLVGGPSCFTKNASIVSRDENIQSSVPISTDDPNFTGKDADDLGGGQKLNSTTEIWVPSNPRGAERLPPEIVEAETDLYLRRLWGKPSEDLRTEPKYLMAFTVGYNQKHNIDATIKKLSSKFSIILFHYDGRTTEWNEFEWAKRAVHISVPKQTKWWYAKRFLHPDVVAKYDYIFVWDEDLGVDHFDAEKYLKLVRKHGLEISQPGVEPGNRPLTWKMTQRRRKGEVHKQTEEKPGWCSDPHTPPCAGFVEIMAPVFSRKAWRCVWYMIQNDLVHGWGLDFALRKCVEPAHEKIGVVDAQWIVHQGVPSLGSQGDAENSRNPWLGVRDRCEKEWKTFQKRLENAEKVYYKSIGVEPPNSTMAQGIDLIIPRGQGF